MFKKEPHVKALSNLKNSEAKRLLAACRAQTGKDDYTFPTNVIKQTNFQAQANIGTVYTDAENNPIWFKEKHDSLLYPTVFTCWSCPQLLPVVITHGFVIEERLFNGANLMLAGTVPPFDGNLKPGKLCGIASKGAPDMVMAVGVVQLDLPIFESVRGKTGVAVQIVHFLPDGLSKVFKINAEPPVSLEDSDEEVEHANGQPAHGEAQEIESAVDINDVAEVLEEFRLEDVDQFLTRALFYTLKYDAKLELPISASKFISNHINHNLPAVDHEKINIKKSSWKKTAKFLKHFEKEGFLKLKGKGDDLTIVGICKDKPELQNFQPYQVGGSTTISNQKRSSKKDSPQLRCETLYKPINLAKDFIQQTELNPQDTLYTVSELKNALSSYIATQNLADAKNRKLILLDDLLFGMVNKKRKDTNTPRVVSRADIVEPFLANSFTPHFQIYKNDIPLFKHPSKGNLPNIEIVTEMKIGRKVVTKVSKFEVFGIDPDDLAATLRKICSGSTTIGETMTSPKTAEVVVQGPHGPLIIDHLNSLGIPSKWIKFENKLKKKKGK
ncbi:TMA64 (YDR117C) [Zygosaccharomyces parabailii]|nr:TMA64 (YDR117C) [Zygosaccharomyces parabailii]